MAARDLFARSTWFRKALKFSELRHDRTYIISVPRGILPLDEIVTPEEGKDFPGTQGKAFKEFTTELAEQIKQSVPAGSELYFYVCNKIRRVTKILQTDYVCFEPTKGTKGIGEQLQKFNSEAEGGEAE